MLIKLEEIPFTERKNGFSFLFFQFSLVFEFALKFGNCFLAALRCQQTIHCSGMSVLSYKAEKNAASFSVFRRIRFLQVNLL